MAQVVTIPNEDYAKLMADSVDKQNVIKILETTFPDEACQLLAVKTILGIQ